jgi:hypothetical protein
MTLEAQITALLEEAAPLRCLPDEEAEAAGLPALVERINALRARAAGHAAALGEAQDALAEAEADAVMAEVNPPKRRGRPPKAKQEGADA